MAETATYIDNQSQKQRFKQEKALLFNGAHHLIGHLYRANVYQVGPYLFLW